MKHIKTRNFIRDIDSRKHNPTSTNNEYIVPMLINVFEMRWLQILVFFYFLNIVNCQQFTNCSVYMCLRLCLYLYVYVGVCAINFFLVYSFTSLIFTILRISSIPLYTIITFIISVCMHIRFFLLILDIFKRAISQDNSIIF